jgi:hypothetical protein
VIIVIVLVAVTLAACRDCRATSLPFTRGVIISLCVVGGDHLGSLGSLGRGLLLGVGGEAVKTNTRPRRARSSIADTSRFALPPSAFRRQRAAAAL